MVWYIYIYRYVYIYVYIDMYILNIDIVNILWSSYAYTRTMCEYIIWIWCYEYYMMNIFWIYSEYIVNILWIYCECIMNILWIYWECMVNVLWIYFEYVMNILFDISFIYYNTQFIKRYTYPCISCMQIHTFTHLINMLNMLVI